MRPAGLEAIDLAVASGSGGLVNNSGPFDPAEAKLWGVPVVVSTSLAPKEAYLMSDDSVRIYADVQARFRVEWRARATISRRTPSALALRVVSRSA